MTQRLIVLSALSSLLFACSDDPSGGGDTTSDVAGDTASDTTGDTSPDEDSAGSDTTEPPPIVDIDPWIEVCGDPPDLAGRDYNATIRWASYGVPYIKASDVPSVVFGQSYAMTRDHICTLADQYVATRSERSLYFGAGEGDANVVSDFGWLGLGLREKANCQLGTMTTASREMIRAVAAGYNKYVNQTAAADLPGPCKDAEWVKPVSELDVASYFLSVVERASGLPLLGIIGTTQPPEASTVVLMMSTPLPQAAAAPGPAVPAEDSKLGSNGWGIGGDRTESGRGMLLVNPHFPWEGALRFYESHLTVPGTLDAHGTALVGTPTLLIGFNKDVAWTHTVSSSSRFAMYALTLDPDDPTVYLYENERRRMSTYSATIKVKQADDSLVERSRTFYQSHYGPMLSVAPLTWTSSLALTYRDANINNTRMFDQWLAKDMAGNLTEFQQTYKNSGIPWVNTLYADRDGNAFYIDGTQVPHYSQEALDWWQRAVAREETGLAAGVALLVNGGFGAFSFDGSIAAHEWVEDDAAAEPGLVPYDAMPKLARRDFIMNANDSHWMSNPAELLEGYSLLYGPEGTERSARTRMNARQLAMADAASGTDGKFSMDELKSIRTNGRTLLSEEWLAGVVTRCAGVDSVEYEGATVPIAAACTVLSNWDGRATLDSVGPGVWRELVAGLRDLGELGAIYAVPFDVTKPATTPNGLAPAPAEGPDPILQALAIAVQSFDKTRFTINSTWGELQYTMKGDMRIPIPGAYGSEGAMNVQAYSRDRTTLLPKIPRAPVVHARSGLTEEGYLITYGTSTVMAIEFTADGVQADGLLTYSQSADPASPHFSDQTEIYGQDGWRKILFTEEELATDPNLTVEVVTSN